jgi:nitrous oxide reductase accessory protein NosL
MKKILAIVLMFTAFACNQTVDQSPREINWDRDICVNCLMGLADQKYSVQAINEYEDVIWFDDLGCLIQYMDTEDWKKFGGNKAKIWIGDCETGEWLDATKAWYRYGDRTPMGYGYGALKEKGDSTYSFETVVQRIHDGITMREAFIKDKKLMMQEKENE